MFTKWVNFELKGKQMPARPLNLRTANMVSPSIFLLHVFAFLIFSNYNFIQKKKKINFVSIYVHIDQLRSWIWKRQRISVISEPDVHQKVRNQIIKCCCFSEAGRNNCIWWEAFSNIEDRLSNQKPRNFDWSMEQSNSRQTWTLEYRNWKGICQEINVFFTCKWLQIVL